VPVPGINRAVFLVLVKFLYYGEIYAEGVDKKEIFKVADRFDCQALKDRMERDLCDQIRISNCLEFMILAEAHSCPLRLQQSVRVVAKHIAAVHFQPEWKSIMTNESLLTKILVCKSQQPDETRVPQLEDASGVEPEQDEGEREEEYDDDDVITGRELLFAFLYIMLLVLLWLAESPLQVRHKTFDSNCSAIVYSLKP